MSKVKHQEEEDDDGYVTIIEQSRKQKLGKEYEEI